MIKVILMILLLSAVEDPVIMTVEFPDMASCMAARKDVAQILGSHFITPTNPPVQILVRCYEGETGSYKKARINDGHGPRKG